MKNIIKLRKIRKEDLKHFLKWWKDRDLINLTSRIYEESDDVLKKYFINFLKNSNDNHFIILLGDKVVGNISLMHNRDKTAEMHIVIGVKKYQGKGYGTLAINQAVKKAFEKLGYQKIIIEVRPDNLRAIKAYKKCGFTENGLKRYPKNKYQPLVLKMLLRK
jgi:RimJ/RimL family protein N-acetyltransferase